MGDGPASKWDANPCRYVRYVSWIINSLSSEPDYEPADLSRRATSWFRNHGRLVVLSHPKDVKRPQIPFLKLEIQVKFRQTWEFDSGLPSKYTSSFRLMRWFVLWLIEFPREDRSTTQQPKFVKARPHTLLVFVYRKLEATHFMTWWKIYKNPFYPKFYPI